MWKRYEIYANKYNSLINTFKIAFLNSDSFKVEDLQRGLSKPLQEMILSSGDEDSTPSQSGSYKSGTDSGTSSFYSGSGGRYFNYNRRNDSHNDDLGDDEDEDDEDDDDDEV